VKIDRPAVIFGDHTQVLKLIDFNFVVGADGVKILKPKPCLNASFLKYFLEANPMDSRGYARHYRYVKELYVPIPPPEEQKRIVAVLNRAFAALDRARANTEANLADAIELKERSIEHELSSEALGPFTSIGPHVDLLTGFAFKSSGYSNDPRDIRLIRGDNIVQGEIRWDGVKRWPIRERKIYEKYGLALDDVLIAMDRTWVSAGIKYAIVDDEALPSLLVQRVARLRAKSSIVPRYLGYWIGSKIFERYVLSIQTGLGVPHVSGRQIENSPIRVPSVEEQIAIVNRLHVLAEGCRSLTTTYKRKLADIAALRQSILQKAFAGELT
jgi:type I restriction enzyme S subunit